jgi:hypothetical protein
MDTTAVTPVATTAPSLAPAVASPQVVTTPPANTPAPASNGSFQSSLKKAVTENPVGLLFGILGTTALIYAIYYFQYNIRFSKNFVKMVENKMDDLDIKYADLASKQNRQEATQQQESLELFI